MRLNRTQIVFYSLALLSACAGAGKPAPAASPEVPLRAETASAKERKKAPAPDKAIRPAARPERADEPGSDIDPENNVYFSSGDTKLNEQSLELLRRHAARLKENPQQVVTLIGYTDPLGSPSYNLAIAEERMDSVAETLRSLGVARGQIRRVSTGRTMATAADCNTPACRRQMRRVELIYER